MFTSYLRFTVASLPLLISILSFFTSQGSAAIITARDPPCTIKRRPPPPPDRGPNFHSRDVADWSIVCGNNQKEHRVSDILRMCLRNVNGRLENAEPDGGALGSCDMKTSHIAIGSVKVDIKCNNDAGTSVPAFFMLDDVVVNHTPEELKCKLERQVDGINQPAILPTYSPSE